MALDMWFQDDIRNVLLGLNMASRALVTSVEYQEGLAFQRGFQAALLATAISFGIVPREIAMTDSSAQMSAAGVGGTLAPPSRE